ncbi:MAG: hypothetical protein Q8R57_12135 [Bacteroidota bacterium]|nr:hypothetical protein [Bacteroidota bacterium]
MVEIKDKQPILPKQDSFQKIYWLLLAFLLIQMAIYYVISIQLQ